MLIREAYVVLIGESLAVNSVIYLIRKMRQFCLSEIFFAKNNF